MHTYKGINSCRGRSAEDEWSFVVHRLDKRKKEREKREREKGLSEKCAQTMDLKARLVSMANGHLI